MSLLKVFYVYNPQGISPIFTGKWVSQDNISTVFIEIYSFLGSILSSSLRYIWVGCCTHGCILFVGVLAFNRSLEPHPNSTHTANMCAQHTVAPASCVQRLCLAITSHNPHTVRSCFHPRLAGSPLAQCLPGYLPPPPPGGRWCSVPQV